MGNQLRKGPQRALCKFPGRTSMQKPAPWNATECEIRIGNKPLARQRKVWHGQVSGATGFLGGQRDFPFSAQLLARLRLGAGVGFVIDADLGLGRSVRFNRYLVGRNGQRLLVIYWYQEHERVIADELLGKFYLVWDSIRLHRRDGPLVRFSLPLANSAKHRPTISCCVLFGQLRRLSGISCSDELVIPPERAECQTRAASYKIVSSCLALSTIPKSQYLK